MRIMITNDDGVYAPGIIKLAKAAKAFGEIYVVAPEEQCSAMSQRITIYEGITIREVFDFPVDNVKVYAVGGTPTDCVKAAVHYIFTYMPDIVFSGINRGYNAGVDIAYSGTVGAAMEAVIKGIPAIAFSNFYDGDYELIDQRIHEIIAELINKSAGKGSIWNVNFPAGKASECKGILYDRILSKSGFNPDIYDVISKNETCTTVMLRGSRAATFEEGTDLFALQNGYISIGIIKNIVMSR